MNPTTAAEWARKVWVERVGADDIEQEYVDDLAADFDAYARQQVEAFREKVIKWLDNEDKSGDPDDLYTGRVHRVAAIRALEDAPPQAS